MNEAVRLTALFIRDLLDYDEDLIRIGRDNTTISDFKEAYIGVDSLAPARRLSQARSYDGVSELENIAQRWSAPIVIWFYGDGAWQRANDYSVFVQTEKANQIQQELGISVFLSSTMTDTKILTGQQYGERIEMQANVHYSTSADVSVLRIDEAQFSVLTEGGVQYQQ